jgi:drug/metabolite transporter (DMT)-like permease
VGSVLFGGVLGPVLLMNGLTLTPAATASLLLNLEAALTALLAWLAFREHVDRRIAAGMGLIVLGGLVLSWEGRPELTVPWGPLAVTGACLAWAIDNNLTRRVSEKDPVQVAGIKGLAAGCINLGLALVVGAVWPQPPPALSAAAVGLLGYGVSLVLFVLALRHLGTARTSAYFSSAPFIGAVLALVLLREVPGAGFWAAAVLMSAGLWLHLTERHGHLHWHEPLTHGHRHAHDEHHQHAHGFPWDGCEPHAHVHVHDPLNHSHPHYPDTHHRHGHE